MTIIPIIPQPLAQAPFGGLVGLGLPRKMWGRLWPLLLSFLTATAVPGPSLRRPSRELDATPRMTIPYEGLTAPTSKGSRSWGLEVGRQAVPGLGSLIPLSPELSGTRHFKGQAQNYSTLLLEEASARLLVGARGALFSLNAQDIGDGTHKEVSPWSLDCPEGIQLHSAS